MTPETETANYEAMLRDFEESYDQSQPERDLAEQCRDYYDGNQLTGEEREALAKRGQPIVISNQIKPKVDSVLGFEKRSRTDPRCYPRTPKHQHEAEAATDALRFICDRNRFQSMRSEVAESLLVEGIGAATVGIRKRGDDFEVALTHVPWDRFYRDPHSRKRDFADAKYLGVVIWLDEDEAAQMFPGREEVLAGAYTTAAEVGETYDDRPKVTWSDTKRKRIRVLQHRYIKGGVWMTCVVCRGGFLRDPQPSPYLDEYGQPECDLIAVSAYVSRENVRYGIVQQMLSAQDEINKRRSKALHRLSVRQVIADDGAVDSVAVAKAEMAKPDGFIKVNPDRRFEIQDWAGAMSGELELLREAKGEINTSGVNPSLQGNLQAPSGRAQEVSQAAALSELSVVFDSMRDWSLRVYRAMWNRVRQYWTEEKWVRVTDDERNMRWVGLNKPLMAWEAMVRQAEQAGQPLPPEQVEAMKADPMLQQPVGVENEVASLDVDIIVEEGPDSITIQSEQFSELVELKKVDPASIPTKLIIEASSLRNKEKILEEMESGGVPPQVQQMIQQGQEEMQQLAAKLQQAEQQLADRSLDGARLEVERQKVEAQLYEAQTERMRAQTELMAAQRGEQAPAAKPAETAPQPQALESVGAGIFQAIEAAGATRVKQGRMVRLPDGSYEFQIIEATP